MKLLEQRPELSDFCDYNLWFQFVKKIRNQRSSGSGLFQNFQNQRTSSSNFSQKASKNQQFA
jgi:hypothetical protein